jgi:hypothetical protein
MEIGRATFVTRKATAGACAITRRITCWDIRRSVPGISVDAVVPVTQALPRAGKGQSLRALLGWTRFGSPGIFG